MHSICSHCDCWVLSKTYFGWPIFRKKLWDKLQNCARYFTISMTQSQKISNFVLQNCLQFLRFISSIIHQCVCALKICSFFCSADSFFIIFLSSDRWISRTHYFYFYTDRAENYNFIALNVGLQQSYVRFFFLFLSFSLRFLFVHRISIQWIVFNFSSFVCSN